MKAQGQTKTGTVSVKENRMALCIRKWAGESTADNRAVGGRGARWTGMHINKTKGDAPSDWKQ